MYWAALTLTLLTQADALPAAGTSEARPSPVAAAADAAAIHDQFLALFATGRFAEALPLALRLVELTELKTVPILSHSAALNDLGLTQEKLGDLTGAEQSYLRSLDWLEGSRGLASPEFITPLVGIARVYAAQGMYPIAIDFFRQALTVSRRAYGLFNPGQASTLESLADTYMAAGDYAAAETERRYLVLLAERSYGTEDMRVIPALQQLANWYEAMDAHEKARLVYLRMFLIAGEIAGGNNVTTVEALLGIGRTHRQQFTADPESLGRRNAAVDQVSQMPMGGGIVFLQQREFKVMKLDRDGFRALEQALELLKRQADPPADLLGRTYLELGDWFLAARQSDKALEYYRLAHGVYASDAGAGLANPLLAPRLVAFRPPSASIRNRWLAPTEVAKKSADFSLTVTDKGATEDVVVGASDMTAMQAFHVEDALKSAAYSPRFENGEPVATQGVEFKAQWFDLAPPKTPAPEAQNPGS